MQAYIGIRAQTHAQTHLCMLLHVHAQNTHTQHTHTHAHVHVHAHVHAHIHTHLYNLWPPSTPTPNTYTHIHTRKCWQRCTQTYKTAKKWSLHAPPQIFWSTGSHPLLIYRGMFSQPVNILAQRTLQPSLDSSKCNLVETAILILHACYGQCLRLQQLPPI